jgi:hypothetical protein
MRQPNLRLKLSARWRRIWWNAQWKSSFFLAAPAGRSLSATRYTAPTKALSQLSHRQDTRQQHVFEDRGLNRVRDAFGSCTPLAESSNKGAV